MFLCGCSVVAVWLPFRWKSVLACSSTEAFQLLQRDFSKISCPLLNYNLLFYLSFFPPFLPPTIRKKKLASPLCFCCQQVCAFVCLLVTRASTCDWRGRSEAATLGSLQFFFSSSLLPSELRKISVSLWQLRTSHLKPNTLYRINRSHHLKVTC